MWAGSHQRKPAQEWERGSCRYGVSPATRTPSVKTNSPLLGAIEGSIAPRSMRVVKAARQSSRLADQKRSSGLPLFVVEWCLASIVQLPERMSLHVAASLSTVFVSRVPHSATSIYGCATGISSTSTFPVCFLSSFRLA